MAKAKVDQDACIGCGACEGACKYEAISLNDGKAGVDESKCQECGECVGACPMNAISQ